MIKMLTSAELAKRLGVHKDTVKHWRVQGGEAGPPYVKMVGSVRYDPEEVETWISKHRRKSTSDAGERR